MCYLVEAMFLQTLPDDIIIEHFEFPPTPYFDFHEWLSFGVLFFGPHRNKTLAIV